MAKLPQRIFALTFAILFFASASAFAVYVVYNAVQTHKHASSDTASQNANNATAVNCQDNGTEPADAAPAVFKTSSPVTSLEIKDLTPGTGQAAKNGDCLVVKYYGSLAKTGAVFDQNYTTTTGFAFTLGQGQVIQGWDKGMVGMKVGGVRQLVIPAAQAYGSASPSASIPANSDLVFVVKLLRIQS